MNVLKFGGTSVKDAEAIGRVVRIVAAAHTAARRDGPGASRADPGPVVVVSAMARITDDLLHLAALAVERRSDDARASVRRIQERHIATTPVLHDWARRAEACQAIDRECEDLGHLARALSVLGEVSPRSQDAMAAVGELLSSRLVAAALSDQGVPATWIDARQVIVTTDAHTAAQPLPDETAARLETIVRPLLRDGRVPVVGGFVGASRAGATTTLGRGGSDYSASIVGAALGAREIQIWTDVDGMLTADPRVVPFPTVVPELSFDEAAELAYFGAKVLHPSTIWPAVERGIPVRILNSQRPEATGTLITASPAPTGGTLTAIACKRGITRIDITSTRMLMAYGFLRRVFDVFERFRTPVDVVTTSEVSVSVTIDDCRDLPGIVEALGAFAGVRAAHDRAIVSAVGERLGADPTAVARVLAAFDGLPLEMVSQGGSRKNVTVVLPDEAATVAMRRLHARFFEQPSPASA